MSLHLLASFNSSRHGSFPVIRRSRGLSGRAQISARLRESYRLLRLPEGEPVSPERAKESYLRLAKLYHPDSGAPTADAAAFARVEEAYRSVLAQSRDVARDEDRDRDEDPFSGEAPQHRHYLTYEGVGSGTPGQRERQYRHFRADRAAERVLDYRQKEHEREAATAEGALAERDVRRRSRAAKITQAVERLVEDLIQESMARGDFRNLSGAGKPLDKFRDDPYADPTAHNLNRILADNGYQPPWVLAQREIRETAAGVRAGLLDGRVRLGRALGPPERLRWAELRAHAGEELAELNKKVDGYNLIAPMLKMQMVHYDLAREARRAEEAAERRALERRRARKEEMKKINAAEVASKSVQAERGLASWLKSWLG
ncbi:dnaJ homolog subfamily C member 28 [Stigmatopora argus]